MIRFFVPTSKAPKWIRFWFCGNGHVMEVTDTNIIASSFHSTPVELLCTGFAVEVGNNQPVTIHADKSSRAAAAHAGTGIVGYAEQQVAAAPPGVGTGVSGYAGGDAFDEENHQ